MSAAGNGKNEESLPLNADTKASDIDAVESYGAIVSKVENRYRELNNWDILIFTLIFWNLYLCRKLMYPFTQEFAQFYDIPVTSFSFILSAFEIGGASSIILTLFPSLHNIRIRLMIFLMIFTVGILYFILSFCYIFISLFILRMGMGFLGTTIVAQLRAIMSIFTKEGDDNQQTKNNKSTETETKLTFRVLACELSWFTSSVGWIIVGVILHRLNVLYVWYFGCICAVLTSLTCYFLPSLSVSHVLSMKSKLNMKENTDELQKQSLLKQYHLYPFFFGSIVFGCGYSMFLATFGPWMQLKFNLNAEQLGFQTLFISFAELTALLTTSCASKYKTNMWLCIFATTMCVLSSMVFIIGLSFDIIDEIFVWILLFVLTMFVEYSFLNFIVANLTMTPHGLESKSSLLLQTLGRASSVVGVIMGLHIMDSYGFILVMECIFGCYLMALISFVFSHKMFQRHKSNVSKNNDSIIQNV